MKIGIFDSGLGGLVIAKSLFELLPKYDYAYLGDTQNLPYGNKSQTQIYKYTLKAVEYLFQENCQLVIIACNTASAAALRKIQQVYLPKAYPDRRVLGVIIPTLETADTYLAPVYKKGREGIIGVIGTTATIKSHIYQKELGKIDSRAKIFELATPKLVSFIEQDSLQNAAKSLKLYLKPLQKQNIEALVLGCTHYPLLKSFCKKLLGQKVAIISQDEIIPKKLKNYLKRHPKINNKLSKQSVREFWVTLQNMKFNQVAKRLFGKKLKFKLAKY